MDSGKVDQKQGLYNVRVSVVLPYRVLDKPLKDVILRKTTLAVLPPYSHHTAASSREMVLTGLSSQGLPTTPMCSLRSLMIGARCGIARRMVVVKVLMSGATSL